MRFAHLERLLKKNGWQLIRIKGSHHIFGGEDRPILSIPVHGNKVKGVYVRQVKQAIKALGQHDDEARS
ncbi:MAG: type II toxin-antitoxin system HicA family toxin [Leptolyngbya sp. PLA3]|nr:MAG: type II toxin-antitoxin system HicA family toxin [Cyanobacteria bacterium CYA]MCE7969713.1 type II toxin-antitoxin system HicA family toxin [Leptolyngbya sp. PL-A3]